MMASWMHGPALAIVHELLDQRQDRSLDDGKPSSAARASRARLVALFSGHCSHHRQPLCCVVRTEAASTQRGVSDGARAMYPCRAVEQDAIDAHAASLSR
jgi:hypothetical protein